LYIFILPRFSGGGAERVILNLLTELYLRHNPVCIIVFDSSGPLLSKVPKGVPVYNLGTIKLKYSIIHLIKKINQIQPKVVFSTFGYINVALLAIRWLLPRKTKIFIREANLPSISLPNNSYTRLMNILYQFLYRTSDKLICSSIRMKDEFVLDFSVPESTIEILPNPIDVDLIRSSSTPIKRFDRGGVCYISAGRLTFQKGFDRLLRWFSKLDDKNSTLVILGDGDLKYELLREVALLSLQEQVRFVGFCDNPWKWYAGADVFLLSSRWEGMPNSVLESLACGTPVIATDESGGIKEITNNGVTTVTGSQQFIKAMKKVDVKDKELKYDSLLPEKYIKENVASIVEGWLCNHPKN
jgi:glycosyltransferase involved in cell wall biosynthesis